MKIKYSITLIIYSIPLLGQLLILLMYAFGMKENVEINRYHLLLISAPLITILYLSVFPYLIKSWSRYKLGLGALNLALLLMSSYFCLMYWFSLDLTFKLAFLILIFGLSGITLIFKTGQMMKNNK